MCSFCPGDYENPAVTQEPEVCGECGHEVHGLEGCEADRTIEVDGIEIDGPCSCTYSELREKKREVEQALFRNGGLRNFLTERRGA